MKKHEAVWSTCGSCLLSAAALHLATAWQLRRCCVEDSGVSGSHRDALLPRGICSLAQRPANQSLELEHRKNCMILGSYLVSQKVFTFMSGVTPDQKMLLALLEQLRQLPCFYLLFLLAFCLLLAKALCMWFQETEHCTACCQALIEEARENGCL